MKRVWIGCSGWSYQDWKAVPKIETVAGWVEQTPGGFLFAVKGSRYLTHMRRLRNIEGGVARFWEPLAPLREAGKLGPVLWQLPENFERDDALLERTLNVLPRLHYGSRGRAGNYSSAELDRLRRRIAAWRSRREVFVYLNNDWRGFAPANARELRRGLSAVENGV